MDLLAQKLGSDFDALDANGDGFLSPEDLTQRVEATRIALGDMADPSKYGALQSATMRWWDQMSGMSGAVPGQRVSREEYISAHVEADRDVMDAVLIEFVDALFDYVDLDGNQQLTAEEFHAFASAWGIEDPQGAFDALDADGSGSLTKQEFQGFVRDFYTSTDPNARGNNLMGPM
ncbi:MULTISPECIES: EF-hand domain-containing protein [Actinosynnema]|uniref:EF-hand domain-containing protein n=1 Tax=Actinosynnema TaxID=40566 RepID=UPI0020A4A63C|nr:EF-hand domain-containing protein [Actinosynnema pretiosum]